MIQHSNISISSVANNTILPLSGGATFTGAGELNGLADVMVSCKTDTSGVLYFDFSNDGTNWDTFPTAGFTVASGIHEFHTAVKGNRYFRVRLVNGVTPQSYLRLYTYYGQFRQGNAPLNQSIGSDTDAMITRGVIVGETDGGIYKNVPVTAEGHLEVAIHSPRLPFGSIHVESLNPVFQYDFVYGVNSGHFSSFSSGSGNITVGDSLVSLNSGTTIYSQVALFGRKRLRYRAGQGIVGRFTALFTSPVPYSYQISGFGTAESGVYFGYGDTSDLTNVEFGILHVRGGVREVRTLTITTASTTNQNVTVTLNGVAYTIAVTNSNNIQRTVYELSLGTYSGWECHASEATLVFVSNSTGPKTNTYSISGDVIVGTFARTKAGVASTDTFIPQSEWNGDKLDGNGSSGITIDPTKGNVFQILIQYLGFGGIVFQVEAINEGNNPDFVTVHTLNYPNKNTLPSFSNPSFPFMKAVYSAGSTTDLSVKGASVGGFIEGAKVLHGNRFSYYNQLTTVGSTNYQVLMTIQNKLFYNDTVNQAVINVISVSGALKHNSPCVFYLVRNATLNGNPNFVNISANSCSNYDVTATTGTWSTGDQLVWTGHLGDTGELDHHFGNGTYNAEELTLQPGETITLFARATAGSPSYVTGSINTREDQ